VTQGCTSRVPAATPSPTGTPRSAGAAIPGLRASGTPPPLRTRSTARSPG